MSIYEIEQAIMNLVIPETGEITDYESLDALNMVREEKIENIALWIKNLNAESKAIREEEKSLAERRRAAENKSESLRKYLDTVLAGEKFTTAKVAIIYRKSASVEIIDEAKFIEDMVVSGLFEYLNYMDPTINRKALSDALKNGASIAGAELAERNNMQIK